MYDPNSFPGDQPYRELNDPTFWAQIAAQVDTTALLHPDAPVQTPRYPSNPQQQSYPTTERLWHRTAHTTAITIYHPGVEEETDPTTQAPAATEQRAQTKKQGMLLPVILIGLAAMMILAVLSTAPTGKFNDTTPEVPGTWNVHCYQNTPVRANGSYSIVGPATIDAGFINQVLDHYHSPMAGQGQLFEDVSRYCGLDPAFVLAFYMHESMFGLAGEARFSRSPGNLRCIPEVPCQDGYAWFNRWQDGLMVQCRLLRNLYVETWGLYTPEQIIPKYAPTSDNNDEFAYEYALEHAVNLWRHHVVVVS